MCRLATLCMLYKSHPIAKEQASPFKNDQQVLVVDLKRIYAIHSCGHESSICERN
jgi:hypothetical protein